MKLKLKSTMLCAAIALSLTASARATIISIADSTTNPPLVSGIIGTDYLLYQQQANNLVPNNAITPASVLSGAKTQSNPGGCVRIYLNSYTDTLSAFATATRITLSGVLGSNSVVLSSLNGVDWFTDSMGHYNTSFGATTLANQWFAAFLKQYNFATVLTEGGYGSQIAAQEAALFTSFANNPPSSGNGFQHLSGPSISYVQEDTSDNVINIGLADTDGFLYPKIVAYVTAFAPNALPYLPSDVYASKLVLLSVNGGAPQPLYSFSSVPSGLTTTDNTDSDSLEFQVSVPVPEPATMGLALAAGTLLLGRRRWAGR